MANSSSFILFHATELQAIDELYLKHRTNPNRWKLKKYSKDDYKKVFNDSQLNEQQKRDSLYKMGLVLAETFDSHREQDIKLISEINKQFPEISALSLADRNQLFLTSGKIVDSRRYLHK